MVRFQARRQKKNIRLLLSVLLLMLALLLFIKGTGFLSGQNLQLAQQTLTEALTDNTVQYYALNGFYPESLDALLASFPIQYDPARFFIDYQPQAANILPEITVIIRK